MDSPVISITCGVSSSTAKDTRSSRDKLLILGMNPSTTVNCLSPADIENVRTGKELPPAPAPATASDLPNGFRRVLINDQQMFCWNTYMTETVTWSWCDF